MKVSRVILTAALLFTSSTLLLAQGQGTVEGRALDALNLSPLLGWEVDVIRGDFQQSTTVDEYGKFEFTQLPTGLFNIRAKSPRGQIQTLHEILVRSSKPTYVELLLSLIHI